MAISKRQLVRLLNENHEGFIAEAQDALRAGLQTSSWVSVDDTGARHAGKNGFCTQIGNEWFAPAFAGQALVRLALVKEPAELPGSPDQVR